MKLSEIVRNLPQENVESISIKYGTKDLGKCDIEMHTEKDGKECIKVCKIKDTLFDYKDNKKFSSTDRYKIKKIECDYIGQYGFGKNTLEGIESKYGRIYGYKWDLLKLYLDKEFLAGYNDEERIVLINNIIPDMLEYNYFGKGIQMIHDTFLTKEYIEDTLQNELFKEVLEKDLNISEMRNKLLNK